MPAGNGGEIFFLWSALGIVRVQAAFAVHLLFFWTQLPSVRLDRGPWTADRGLGLSLNHLLKWLGNWFRWANAGEQRCSTHSGGQSASARYKMPGQADPSSFLKSLPEPLSKVFDTP